MGQGDLIGVGQGGSEEAKSESESELAATKDRLREAERRLSRVDPERFYLVGQAKSGTTWLMRTLNAHPEILCIGEGRIFPLAYKRPDLLDAYAPTFQPSSLSRALDDSTYLDAWVRRSVWSRDDDRDQHMQGLTLAAIRHFFSEKLEQAGKRVAGDKTPFIGPGTIAAIAAVDDAARVIQIIRDGRDVAVSGMHNLWSRELDLGNGVDLRDDEREIRDRYRADPTKFRSSGESIFAQGRLASLAAEWATWVLEARQQGPELLGQRYTEVRYEDLSAEPLKEVHRLVSFLGADGRRQVIQNCVSRAAFKRGTGGRPRGTEMSSHLMRKGVVGDWKEVFTAEDREIFEQAAGSALRELGYEHDDSWVQEPEPSERDGSAARKPSRVRRPQQTPVEALERSDRSLRRLLKHVRATIPEPDEKLEKELRVARRQVRGNDRFLDR